MTPIFWGGYQTQSPEENEVRIQRLTQFYKEDLPLKRAGTPEDIAYAAVYLASDESLHTTGLNMRVDSGLTCQNRPRQDLIARSDKRRRVIIGEE